MSRIDELIAELCPHGVPVKSIGEVAEIANNGVDKKSRSGEQAVWLVNFVDVFNNLEINSSHLTMQVTASERQVEACRLKVGDLLITPTSESKGELARAAVVSEPLPDAVYSYHVMRVRVRSNSLLAPKFLCHLFASSILQNQIKLAAQGITRFGLTQGKWNELKIPIPPLEVQQEIVRILDQFTELEAELEAELEERRKQYEHYRNELLTFPEEGVRWVPMGDVATIVDGTHSTPKYLEAGVPFVSVENIRALNKTTKFISPEAFSAQYKVKPKSGDLLMTRIGSIGECTIVRDNEPLAYYVTLALIRFDSDLVLPEFARHFIESRHGRALISRLTIHTAVPIKINLGDIGRVVIPLPTLEAQGNIASLLDKFDSLVNDITAGLPAEIEARRKQYEYYRDKLLTFPEAAA